MALTLRRQDDQAAHWDPFEEEAGPSALASERLRRVPAGSLTGSVALAENDRWGPSAVTCRARRSGEGF
jgi:hypothetical protein